MVGKESAIFWLRDATQRCWPWRSCSLARVPQEVDDGGLRGLGLGRVRPARYCDEQKDCPSTPANTFETLMLLVQLIGMCFLDFFIMVIVEVELPRFLLVRPMWCHSAAKSRWRAQAPSQHSPAGHSEAFTLNRSKCPKRSQEF